MSEGSLQNGRAVYQQTSQINDQAIAPARRTQHSIPMHTFLEPAIAAAGDDCFGISLTAGSNAALDALRTRGVAGLLPHHWSAHREILLQTLTEWHDA